MESIINFITLHAHHAHLIIFSFLVLAGFNLPISEDILIIISGVLASQVIPENTYKLILFVYLGCLLSDWICFFTGRLLGNRIIEFKWFKKTLSKKRVEKAKNFYDKYGFFTLIGGRFIPFGVRNILLLTAGISKMKLSRFFISDAIACALSNSLLFTVSYLLGKNYDKLIKYIKTFNILIFSFFLIAIIILFTYYKLKKRKNTAKNDL